MLKVEIRFPLALKTYDCKAINLVSVEQLLGYQQ